jgi:lysyl-tRNA synthetase class 2
MNITLFKERARLNRAIRDFFGSRGYTEVETPLLAPEVLPESSIELFKTCQIQPDREPRDLFLIPSPEIWMKQLLSDGSGDIFQICRSFRNSEQSGRWHNPEFTMLEWYGTYLDEMDNIALTEEMFRYLGDVLHSQELVKPFYRIAMDEAFTRWAGFSLEKDNDREALAGRVRDHHMQVTADDTRESLFNKLFLTLVEPELPADRPVALYDYPAFIKTLAAQIPGTPWARRWELYAGGVELANCFAEESDPAGVSRFIREESMEKDRTALVKVITDTGFAEKTKNMPACSGVALGVDRLLAIILQLNSIGEVIYKPL